VLAVRAFGKVEPGDSLTLLEELSDVVLLCPETDALHADLQVLTALFGRWSLFLGNGLGRGGLLLLGGKLLLLGVTFLDLDLGGRVLALLGRGLDDLLLRVTFLDLDLGRRVLALLGRGLHNLFLGVA
jgi:hypothetical protein